MSTSTHTTVPRVPAWDNLPESDHFRRTKPHPFCPICKEPVVGQYVYVEEHDRNNYYHLDCYPGELCRRCLRHGDAVPFTPTHFLEAHGD